MNEIEETQFSHEFSSNFLFFFLLFFYIFLLQLRLCFLIFFDDNDNNISYSFLFYNTYLWRKDVQEEYERREMYLKERKIQFLFVQFQPFTFAPYPDIPSQPITTHS